MRLTWDRLRAETLRRQFPAIPGHGPGAVVALLDRLGPIQSQVPRSPFLTASSRLPGVTYATMTELLDAHRLVKASTLRGTVHTSTSERFPAVEVVARATRGVAAARALGLQRVSTAELAAVIEDYCRDEWRTRDEVVAYVQAWLLTRESPEVLAATEPAAGAGYLWGHSGLLRRPPTSAWQTRTDTLRRTATELLPAVAVAHGFEQNIADLVGAHLAAYGPAQLADLVFFFGITPRQAKTAVAALGDIVVRLAGPDGVEYLDLAEPPPGGDPDPGLRLLPEFDGLLLGFQGRNRLRFLEADQLPRVWAKANGMFAPVLLHEQMIKATWRSTGPTRRTVLEVTMLHGWPPVDETLIAEQARAVEEVLGLQIAEVRVQPS